jgi:hypothetical protein
MVQSAHSFWPPRPLRMSPVNTLQHIGKLRRCDDDDTVCRRRPDELAALQSFGVERHAETVVPKNLDEIATAAAKGEKIAGVRIALQRLLLGSQTVRHEARHPQAWPPELPRLPSTNSPVSSDNPSLELRRLADPT